MKKFNKILTILFFKPGLKYLLFQNKKYYMNKFLQEIINNLMFKKYQLEYL